MFPQSQNLALDNVVTIDMRHGLSESRVRAIQPLTDGRIAVVTAGYLNIFDGTSFKCTHIDKDNGVGLKAVGKNRQLYSDKKGRIWLKSPVNQHEKNGRMHVFDPVTSEDITCNVLKPSITNDLTDLFVDETGQCWLIDTTNTLFRFDDDRKEPLINLNRINDNLPDIISTDGDNIYLCYDDGNVCVINQQNGMLKYKGAPLLPKAVMRHTNAGVKWYAGKLWTAFNRHNNLHNTWIASLDTVEWKWDTKHFNRMIYDFVVDNNGELITDFPSVDTEIFSTAFDFNNGLWIGTKNNGLRYWKPGRNEIIRHVSGKYPYPSSGYYASDKAKLAGSKYASEGINCSAEDSITGYIYLGTPKGIMVVDSLGKLVTTLAENIGLPQSNVQSIVANVPHTGISDTTTAHDDIWFSTTTGISRMRHVSRDTFEVIHLGILDGLDLGGAEFSTQSMVSDSTGHIITGYPGGYCILDPTKIDDKDHVKYIFPNNRRTDLYDKGSTGNVPVTFIVIAGIIVLILSIAITHVYLRRKRRNLPITDGFDSSSSATIDNGIDRLCDNLVIKYRETKVPESASSQYIDEAFANRLNKIIHEHISDESLNVVSLSSLMAMDRTNLYRKMQAVFGTSPSSYIKNVRLTAAAKLLRETDIPIPEIARHTGFSSTKYFSSTFKESFGLLPAKYRSNEKGSKA